MKIAYNWLKNYIDVEVSPEKVAKILTDCGLEVEGQEKIQTVKGGLEGIVIGEVLTKQSHPNADRLNVTTVTIGTKDNLQIVCGALNVEIGQKVVVATVGTTLYSGEESFKIKKSKIRGEVSEGMICAEDEIGLGSSHDGIMVLPSDAIIGLSAKEYFNIEDDEVFEIGLTPNRADATGHIGVARDLITVLNLTESAQLIKPSVDQFKVDNNDLPITVEIENPSLCPRYSGVTLSGIVVKESPDWLKNKLLSIGINPINNIVDVTNYVLHETGQPLHAFDADQIEGNKIKVKTLSDATKFITLDEKERALSDQDLMICNAKEPMCIAGVFGGIKSGVSENTQNIFLESAYFNPVSIRKTAKRHGLNTDASFRYERGADPNITIYALKRAICLMQEVAGGKVSSEIVDVYPEPIVNFKVDFSYLNCARIIGEQIEAKTIQTILKNLEIEVLAETETGLSLSIPPFKVDVQREIDVIEEVLRIYGYNNIALPETMKSSIVFEEGVDKEKMVQTLSGMLVDNGFYETLSNSLTKSSYYSNKETLVEVSNPLSIELDVLRQSMLYSGLETVQYNQNRKSPDLKLFELGKTYLKHEDKFLETHYLSLIITGNLQQENWSVAKEPTNFYHLKGFIQNIIERFGLHKLKLKKSETDLEVMEYGLKYTVNNKALLHLGKIKSSIQQQFDLHQELYYAEINIDVFMELLNFTRKITYKEVSKFPPVKRDLALLIDASIKYEQIENIALKQEKKLLKQVNLFDVYEGKNIESGKKSYAVSFVFQDEEKTLTDTQIDKMMNKLIQSFSTEIGATLR